VNTLTALHFEPSDILFFRDNRGFGPSDSGQTSFPTVFPFYGALRTAFLRKKGVDFSRSESLQAYEKQVGNDEHPGLLRLLGPFLYHADGSGKTRYYLPTPENVYHLGDSPKEFGCLQLDKQVSFQYRPGIMLHPLGSFSKAQPQKSAAEFPWMELSEMEKMKRGESFFPTSQEDVAKTLFSHESRLGIALEKDRKKAKEQMIYRLNAMAFREGAGFFVLVEQGEEILKGLDEVFLGGKRHTARLWKSSLQTSLFDLVSTGDGENEKSLVLLSPGVFENGFVPGRDTGFFGSQLLALSNGKPLVISGWDLKNRRVKQMVHALRPGTVFYVRGNPREEFLTQRFAPFGFGKYFEAKIGRRCGENHGK